MDIPGKPNEKIVIGGKASDKELLRKIYEYQKSRKIRFAADAVRELCQDALAIKNAIK